MPILMRLCLVSVMTVLVPLSAHARQWSDTTGKYTLEADLVGFDDERVILQRENKELGAIEIEKLSKEDRDYLSTKEAKLIHSNTIDKLQTWKTREGKNIVGRVVDYAKRDITIQRRRNKIYVNDTVFDNLPGVYQTLVMRIVAHFESTTIDTKEDLQAWVLQLKGQPKQYHLEGVIFELENGDEYGIPFFIFSLQDQNLLRLGWASWLEHHQEQNYDEMDDHAFDLQSLAATRQQTSDDQQSEMAWRQVAAINMNMQAIQSGLTSAWEVTLYPNPGNPYPPRWVVAMGRNSEVAKQSALANNPGFYAGPIRRVSR